MTGAIERAQLVADIIRVTRAGAEISERIGVVYAGKNGLHNTDFRALTLIYWAEKEGAPLTAVDLARALSITPGAITHSTDRLEAADLVVREHDTQDRRRTFLRTTSKGVALASAFHDPVATAYEKTLHPYSDEELAVHFRIHRDLVEAFAKFLSENGFAE